MGFYFDSVFEHHPFTSDSPELEAVIQKSNIIYLWIYYIYIACIIFCFSFIKFWRRMYVLNKNIRRDLKTVSQPIRHLRKWCLRKCFWPFGTRGHFLVITGYLIINILLSLMSSDHNLLVLQLARRTGWLSIVNFSLLLLLSMKSTPLSKLTGYSYEKLNFLHRWVGVVAWIEGCVHTIAIGLAVSRLVPDQSHILLMTENIFGIVALAAWSIMMVTFPLLKKKLYEYFYVIHIIGFPVVAVALYLHNMHCQIPVLVGVGLYAIDRLVRADRYLWHNRNAKKLKATLKVTPCGSTLVTVPRGTLDWRPGSHAFLNIPRIRYFQSHPFTIASVNDSADDLGKRKELKFLIQPKHGFTKYLQEEARKTKDQMQRGYSKDVTAYVDGPYGGPPDMNAFDRVILLAAGSGVTFVLPIALSLVRQNRVKSVDFIWSVKDARVIEAVREQLLELSGHVRYEKEGTAVNMRLHITGDTSMPKMSTLKRVKSMVKPGNSDSMPYDLYGSSTSLPMPPPMPSPAHMEHDPSREKMTPSPSLDPSDWFTGSERTRVFSGESYLSASSDNSFLQKQSASHDAQDFAKPSQTSELSPPIKVSSPTSAPNVLMPQPKSPLRNLARYAPLANLQRGRSRSNQPAASDPLAYNHSRSPSISPHLSGEATPRNSDTVSPIARSHPFQPQHQHTRSDSNPPALSSDGLMRDEQQQLSSPTSEMQIQRSRDHASSQRNSVRDSLKRYHFSGRPQISQAIEDVLMITDETETVAICACGVVKFTDDVRRVAANNITSRGPSVSLFCEEFGY